MSRHPLVKKVAENITQHGLLTQGETLLVCVSGGSDSVALLHILAELQLQWNCKLHILHFHHGLRPESDSECQFVETLAHHHQLPFHVCHALHLHQESGGVQEKARQWRQENAEKIRSNLQATRIATAHHLDDQTETFLLKLLRGCHLSNLRGMEWKTGAYIRPLLNCKKSDLQHYLTSRSQKWREDPSNQSFKYLRNRIRLELIPLMNELAREGLAARLKDLSDQSQQLHHWIEQEGENTQSIQGEKPSLLVKELMRLPLLVQSEKLHRYLHQHGCNGLTYRHIQQILLLLQKNKLQWVFHLPGRKILCRQGERLFLESPPPVGSQKILCDSFRVTSFLGADWRITGQILVQGAPLPAEGLTLFNLAPQSELSLSYRKPGDRFHPSWKKKSVKLKDFLRDQGIPLHERDRLPLVRQDEKILAIYPHFCSSATHKNEKRFPPLHLKLTFLGID